MFKPLNQFMEEVGSEEFFSGTIRLSVDGMRGYFVPYFILHPEEKKYAAIGGKWVLVDEEAEYPAMLSLSDMTKRYQEPERPKQKVTLMQYLLRDFGSGEYLATDFFYPDQASAEESIGDMFEVLQPLEHTAIEVEI